ncbi:MAG: PAS domain-containing protein [Gammaproteobacteria bacterium]|nr:PAS domain-containing protein [Gammaproteobacteria bacterium]
MATSPFKFTPSGLNTPLDKPWHRDAFIDASHRIAHLGYCEWDYDKGRIISCTPHYAEIFGMSVDEVIESQSSWEKVLAQLHPEDRARYAQSHEEQLGKGTHEIEYRIFRKDGAISHIREVGIVFFDEQGKASESMGLLQDISEQKERIQDLENRDAMAQQVETITDIGHFIWDIRKNQYRFTSPGYLRILGTEREPHEHKVNSLDDYLAEIHEDDRELVSEAYRQHFSKDHQLNIEYRVVPGDGSERWIREKSVVIEDDTSGDNQVIGVIQEITDQKISEQLLRDARDSLETEVELRTRKLTETVDRLNTEISEREVISTELEAKNAELERFTYTVSHDLKSPLVTIRGFLGLLEKDIEAADSKRIAEDIKKLKNATDTMGMLLNDLLELSQVGRVVGETVSCSLSALVKQATELVKSDLDSSAIEIIVEDMPSVKVDESRIVEVFLNLLENAIKFSGEQESPRIHISAKPMDGMICCSVRDNGIGIDEQYHDQIFELFERLDAQVDGTGIGLALVKRIIESHGGIIWVESEGPGLGCTMSLTLPRA